MVIFQISTTLFFNNRHKDNHIIKTKNPKTL